MIVLVVLGVFAAEVVADDPAQSKSIPTIPKASAGCGESLPSKTKQSAKTTNGILSSRYQPGPYTTTESSVNDFVSWYLREL